MNDLSWTAPLRIAWGAGMILASGSCAFHPELSEQERMSARTFTPPPGKALLYVYRPATMRAGLAARGVMINGQHLVSNTNGTFVAIPLRPGKYTIQAALEVPPDMPGRKKDYPDINLTARAGKTYFIRQTVEGSLWGNGGDGSVMMMQTGGAPIPIATGGISLPPFKATLVSEQTGKQECLKLKHVGSDPYNENPAG